MSESKSPHWTEDLDLLEEYVLGKLAPEREQELAQHLEECPQCRRAVQEEQRIAAAIRRYGRNQLKQRLVGLVSQSRHVQVPWPRIASIAAVVAIAVGVAIYGHWSGTSTVSEHEMMQQAAAPEQKDEARTESPTAGGAAEERAGPVQKETVHRDRMRAKPAAPAPTELSAAKKSLAESPAEDKGSAAVPSAGAWVVGQRLAASGANELQVETAPAAAGNVRRFEAEKAEQPQRQMLDKVSVADAQLPVVLLQRRVSDLPTAQQVQQRSLRGVQTLMENTSQGLQMTLFLDSLVTPSQLKGARVEWIGNDSLIVRIDGQEIGYQIPRGLQTK